MALWQAFLLGFIAGPVICFLLGMALFWICARAGGNDISLDVER